MFKSSWGGWLALASIIILPSMLYLTRPVSTDTIQKSKNSSLNRAEVSAEQVEDKNRRFSSASIGHSTNEIDLAEELDVESDRDNMSNTSEEESSISEWEKHDPTANEVFSQVQTYTPPQNYNGDSGAGVSGNRIARPDFSARITIQAESITGTTGSPAQTGQKQGNSNNINASLYLAEIQAPVQNNKSKCPPVYMALNDYAKNMRTAMGCDSQ